VGTTKICCCCLTFDFLLNGNFQFFCHLHCCAKLVFFSLYFDILIFAIWELKASRRWTDERHLCPIFKESQTTRNRDDLLRECATVREWDPVGSVCNCRWSSSDVIFFSSHFNSPVSDNNFSVFYYNISFIFFFFPPFYFLCLRKGRRFIKIFYTIREEG
jgi:hypothetical protein